MKKLAIIALLALQACQAANSPMAIDRDTDKFIAILSKSNIECYGKMSKYSCMYDFYKNDKTELSSVVKIAADEMFSNVVRIEQRFNNNEITADQASAMIGSQTDVFFMKTRGEQRRAAEIAQQQANASAAFGRALSNYGSALRQQAAQPRLQTTCFGSGNFVNCY